MGDAIAANMFMVGVAWQLGGLPVSRAAILEALRMNGVEVAMNEAAFEWGRRSRPRPSVGRECRGDHWRANEIRHAGGCRGPAGGVPDRLPECRVREGLRGAHCAPPRGSETRRTR
jgi:hypothetical protein